MPVWTIKKYGEVFEFKDGSASNLRKSCDSKVGFIRQAILVKWPICSLFQALGQWGRSIKRAQDERDLVKKKLKKAREGEPVSIVLKTSFRPLLKRQRFKDVTYQNVGIFGVELLACVSTLDSMF